MYSVCEIFNLRSGKLQSVIVHIIIVHWTLDGTSRCWSFWVWYQCLPPRPLPCLSSCVCHEALGCTPNTTTSNHALTHTQLKSFCIVKTIIHFITSFNCNNGFHVFISECILFCCTFGEMVTYKLLSLKVISIFKFTVLSPARLASIPTLGWD